MLVWKWLCECRNSTTQLCQLEQWKCRFSHRIYIAKKGHISLIHYTLPNYWNFLLMSDDKFLMFKRFHCRRITDVRWELDPWSSDHQIEPWGVILLVDAMMPLATHCQLQKTRSRSRSIFFWIQKSIPIGCVPIARYRTGGGVTETPLDRDTPSWAESQTGVKTPLRAVTSTSSVAVVEFLHTTSNTGGRCPWTLSLFDLHVIAV